jgi:hypothetical protein
MLKALCPEKVFSVQFGTCALKRDERNNAIDIAKRGN